MKAEQRRDEVNQRRLVYYPGVAEQSRPRDVIVATVMLNASFNQNGGKAREA